MTEDTIKKPQAMCGRRWYAIDRIMETLGFPIVDLIENVCLRRLMIEQVERRRDEAKEKIQALDRVSIEDVDELIQQPLVVEGNIHVYLCIWHKLDKNEMENYKCDVQLGFESANYPNIEEFIGFWNRWRYLLEYQFIQIYLIPI